MQGIQRSGVDPTTRIGVRPLLVCAFAVLLIPSLMVELPPLLDYPNHFARLWLIAGGIHQAPLAEFYAVDWSRAATNIGGDLLAAAFGAVVGKEQVARLLLATAIVAPPLGALLLHRRIFGGNHWWQLTFPFAGWGMVALVGFMNFQIGLGLALTAAAYDGPISRLGALGYAVRAVLAVVTLAFHPFAAAFYIALVTALAIGPDLRDYLTADGIRRLPGIGLVAGATAIPVAIVLFLAPNPVPVATDLPLMQWASFTVVKKLSILTTGFRSYSPAADALVGIVVGGACLYALLRRRLALHGGLLALALALAAASVVMPTRIGEAFWTDRRLPVMSFLTFLAAVRPDILVSRGASLVAASLLAAITLARTFEVAWAWTGGQRDIASVRRALTRAPAGCMVLAVVNTPSEAQVRRAPVGRYLGKTANFLNYPAMAVPWRHAFVPNLFSQAGQQPLRVLPPWIAYSTPAAPPPALTAFSGGIVRRQEYMRHWRDFDYLLVLNADMPDSSGGRLPTEELAPIADEGFAVLYKITPLSQVARPTRSDRISCPSRPT